MGCRADEVGRDTTDPWAQLAAQERATLETDAFLRAHADVRLLERTGLRSRALAPRARQLRLLALARVLDSPALASD